MSSGVHSRFIPAEEIEDGQVVQWRFGAVESAPQADAAVVMPVFQRLSMSGLPEGPQHAAAHASPVVLEHQQAQEPPSEPAAPAWDEAQLQQMLEQAHAEGRAQGQEEGRQEAQQQWQQHMDAYVAGAGREVAQRAESMLSALDASLRQLQSGIAQELLQLACDIARQVVRQELRSQPQALLPVVREALDMLVSENRPAMVRLNPVDFAALDEALRAEHGAHGKVQWSSDASVAPGDVRVDSGGSQIDAGLDKRWRRAVAALGLVSTWYDGEQHGG